MKIKRAYSIVISYILPFPILLGLLGFVLARILIFYPTPEAFDFFVQIYFLAFVIFYLILVFCSYKKIKNLFLGKYKMIKSLFFFIAMFLIAIPSFALSAWITGFLLKS